MKKRIPLLRQILVISLVTLLLLECFARLHFFGWSGFSPKEVNSFDNFFQVRIAEAAENPLPYRLKSNLRTRYKMASFVTNKFGMRDKWYPKSPVAHRYRIAILGDSYSMGTGVEEPEIYHAYAERKLNKEHLSCDILNFGVSGYSLKDYKNVLDQKVLDFRPNEVVIGFCMYNDQLEPGVDFKKVRFRKAKKRSLFWKSYFLLWIRTIVNGEDLNDFRYSDKQIAYIEKQLTEIKERCDSNDIRLSLINLGITHSGKTSAIVKKICQKLDIDFIDSTTTFKKKDTKDYILNELDTHPNKDGHLLLGKSFYRLVKPHVLTYSRQTSYRK